MYNFSDDYVKPKYYQQTKLYHTDTNSSIIYAKIDDIYKYIVENVETRFDTSNFKLHRP